MDKKIHLSLEEILYYLFFGILFAAKGIGLEYGQRPFTLCILISLICLGVKLFLTGHTVKEWLTMAMLVLLGVAIYLTSGELAALAAVLVIIGMKNIPVKRLMGVCLGIWGMTFAFSAVLGILHIKDGVVLVHSKLGLGPVIRWSLGYTHPNVLHVSYFILIALILYVCNLHGKRLAVLTGVLFAGNILVFLYSLSYTGILITTGYLALNFYLDCRMKLCLSERILFQCILPFCVLFPLVGPFVTHGKVYELFNKALSTRFDLVKTFYTTFTPGLFGTRTYFETDAKLTLDSSFAYMLMYYGVIAFTLFVAGYFLVIRQMIRERRHAELAIVIGTVVAGITEQFLFNLSFKNLTLFFLGEFLFGSVLKRKENGTLWNKEICILKTETAEVKLPDYTGYLKTWKAYVREHRIRLVMITVLAVFGFAAVYTGTANVPDGVYVYRRSTDYKNLEEIVHLDMEQLPEDFNSLVIGYQGPDADMYYFTGNIVKLEYVRNVTGAGVLGIFMSAVCAAGISAYSCGKYINRFERQGISNESTDGE